MARTSEKRRIDNILRKLREKYPDAQTALRYTSKVQLLVATILSAQCTDKKVNEVTRTLFKKYKTAKDFAQADLDELEQAIKSTGFYRNKARNIQAACADLVEKHRGHVPGSRDELTDLAGVGRKTANVVLGNAFAQPAITVDTHVKRISQRLQLTDNKDPEKIEFDLMDVLPEAEWTDFSHRFIYLGREICHARKPDCDHCPLFAECPSARAN